MTILQYVLNIRVQYNAYILKSSYIMYGTNSSCGTGRLMKNFCCNIIQELQELEIQLRLWVDQQVCCNKISSIAVKSINRKPCDQLATASSSTPP